jgi:hypothetical protein
MGDGRKPRINVIAGLFTETAPAPGANDFQVQTSPPFRSKKAFSAHEEGPHSKILIRLWIA